MTCCPRSRRSAGGAAADGGLQRERHTVRPHGPARVVRISTCVLDSQDLGVEKPDPRLFEIALERSGAARDSTIHVGDIYHVDVVGARAGRASAPCCSIRPGCMAMPTARACDRSASWLVRSTGACSIETGGFCLLVSFT